MSNRTNVYLSDELITSSPLATFYELGSAAHSQPVANDYTCALRAAKAPCRKIIYALKTENGCKGAQRISIL